MMHPPHLSTSLLPRFPFHLTGKPLPSTGVVEVNPPFDEALVLRTADVCQRRLEAAAAGRFGARKTTSAEDVPD